MRTFQSWLTVAAFSGLTQLLTFILTGVSVAGLVMFYVGLQLEYATYQHTAFDIEMPELLANSGIRSEDWQGMANSVTSVDFSHALTSAQGLQAETSQMISGMVQSTPILGWYGLVGFLIGGIVSVVVIQFSTIYQICRLKVSGQDLAEQLGCLEIESSSLAGGLRDLQSIVEELAPRFDVPVPNVVVLPNEKGINAFVVGRRPQDAVLVVTEGFRHLSGKQARGIVAHELAHVRSRDMVHNMRLLAVELGANSVRRSSEYLICKGWGLIHCPAKNHHSALFTLKWGVFCFVIGLTMWPMGLASSIISSAILSMTNRKRELRADRLAAKILGTWEPISEALQRIYGYRLRSKLRDPETLKLAHLMFASADGTSGGWPGTHPHIRKRIRRADPSWDGNLLIETDDDSIATDDPVDRSSGSDCCEGLPIDAVLETIDPKMVTFFADPDSTILSIPVILCFDESHRPLLEKFQGGRLLQHAETLWATLGQLNSAQQFALTEMTLKAIRPESSETILEAIDQLSALAPKNDWSLQAWLRMYADATRSDRDFPRPKYRDFGSCVTALLEVISIGVKLDGDRALTELQSQRIWASTGLNALPLLDISSYGFADLDDSVEALCLAMRQERQSLVATFASTLSEGKCLDFNEATFVRYLAERMSVDQGKLQSILPG